MSKINITAQERRDLIEAIHANAVDKGFWAEYHSKEHYLMLAITELSEAVEAHRKGDWARREAYQDDLHKRFVDFDASLFRLHIKDSVEDELADALIRIYDIVGAYGYVLFDESSIRWTRERVRANFVEYEPEFTAQVLQCVGEATSKLYRYRAKCSYIISTIEEVAEHNGIDLYWHVREKMQYNATRPALHGKKY